MNEEILGVKPQR